jgi:hypothetical protein
MMEKAQVGSLVLRTQERAPLHMLATPWCAGQSKPSPLLAALDARLESHDQRGPLCLGSNDEVAKCLPAMQAA